MLPGNIDLSERRKFIRFNIPLNMEFSSANKPDSYSSGTTINFSREGFCFATKNTDLSLLDMLDMKIKHPQTEEFIEAHGQIVWKTSANDQILAGIKLNEIDKGAKATILDHAYNIWLDNSRS